MTHHRRTAAPYRRSVAELERQMIERALRDTWFATWNVKRAARVLDMPLSTLKYKMRRLGIRRPS